MLTFPSDLPAPPKLAKDVLRIVPLGGLGEVGRNMTVFEINGKLLVVDCGVLFPEETQPGVDLILPDFEYIRNRLDDIVAIVLTHGHEDHIGAVPYLLRLRKDIPLVGSQLTLAFVTAKLREHRITPVTRVVKEGEVVEFDQFELEFVAVNHSIPDALAVLIATDAGTVLNTGDYKMDQLPLDGRITDLRAFARLGEEGVDLFMVDSTNAEVPGFVRSETAIGPVLNQLFGEVKGKIVVASFSSHVHRVQQVLDAAAAHGRKVAFAGRSMIRNMTIAVDLGFLTVPDGVLIDLKEAGNVPADRIVYMCTGSQGEPMAALGRIANQDHHQITVGEDDAVILASSLVPGNENAVFGVINGLMRLGATVVTKADKPIHTSGHASEGELLYTYNIVQPHAVMPIHGEFRHLIANGEIAARTGVAPDNILLCEDGYVVDMEEGESRVVGQVAAGYVYVDGSSVGGVTDADLKDRRILGDEGFVSCLVVINSESGEIISGPEIHARGVAEEDKVFAEVIPEIDKALKQAIREKNVQDSHQLQQVVRRTLGRWVNRRLRRKPMIIPVVVLA